MDEQEKARLFASLGMVRDGSEERERDLDCEIRRLRREVEIARKVAERDRLRDELRTLQRGAVVEMTDTDQLAKERPIIFSAESVRAILAGRKTQTRRAIRIDDTFALTMGVSARVPCPYGAPGDRLWVRESWAVDRDLDEVRRAREDVFASPAPGVDGGPYYRADRVHENTGLRWRSPIHMPRWASRISLEITSVRVERVQQITPDAVIAEGVARVPRCGCEVCSRLGPGQWCPADASAQIMEFAAAWDSINGKRPGCSWEANPWVWVLTFRRVEKP